MDPAPLRTELEPVELRMLSVRLTTDQRAWHRRLRARERELLAHGTRNYVGVDGR
jgi:hypothetical protein